MAAQIDRVLEGDLAVLAGEWTLFRVRRFMALQVRRLDEALAANLALVWKGT